jgi:hypothetical protein
VLGSECGHGGRGGHVGVWRGNAHNLR